MSQSPLLEPLQLGSLTLPNRVIMAPLTRMRAGAGFVPSDLNAVYYSQRASAGLIITEGTLVSELARGHPGAPGIYSPEQTAGWKHVVSRVHAAGGRIFMQLWHVGRMSHSSIHPERGLPIGPSAVAATNYLVLNSDMVRVPCEVPRAMTTDDIRQAVEEFRSGAANALAAGCDGVEIHSANGYLIDQFLQDGTNLRTDEYGGPVENRLRLLLQIVDAVCTVFPSNRVGVRFSPFGAFNDMKDSDPVALFTAAITALNTRNIAYVHVIEPRCVGGLEELRENVPDALALFRSCFRGVFITAGGYTTDSACNALSRGADAVCFGRHFISNPDLPFRLGAGVALNPYNRATFYGGGAAGYTDYLTADGCKL